MLSPSSSRFNDRIVHEEIVSQSMKKGGLKALQATGNITEQDIESFTRTYKQAIMNDPDDIHMSLYTQGLTAYLENNKDETEQSYIKQKIANYLILNNNTSSEALENIINQYNDKITLIFSLSVRKDDDNLAILKQRFEKDNIPEAVQKHFQNICQKANIDYYEFMKNDEILNTRYNEIAAKECEETCIDRLHLLYNRNLLQIRNTPEWYDTTIQKIIAGLTDLDVASGIDRIKPKTYEDMMYIGDHAHKLRQTLEEELATRQGQTTSV